MEQKRYAQIMQDKCASLLADTQNCNYRIWRSATAKWSDSGIELAYRNATSGQNVQKWKRSFECTLGKRKHPIPQSANLMVSDARQGNPKGMPCPYFITGRGI